MRTLESIKAIPAGWVFTGYHADGTALYSKPKPKSCGPASGQGEARRAGGDAPIFHEPARPAKRLRQSSKPLMNKLETEFYSRINIGEPYPVRIQAVTFRLANGLRYTPDFFAVEYPGPLIGATAWEVKGKWVDGDSFGKLKMAASVWPEIRWVMVWKKNGEWQEQEILP